MTIVGSTSRLDGGMGLAFGVGGRDFMVTGGPNAIAGLAGLIARNAYELRYGTPPVGDSHPEDVATVEVGYGFVTGPRMAIDAIRDLLRRDRS